MRQDFGLRGKDDRSPERGVDGFYLLGRYFMLAGLQPELGRIKQTLSDSTHDDRRKGPDGVSVLDKLVAEIQRKVNEKSGTDIGNKITMKDIEKYIRESLDK